MQAQKFDHAGPTGTNITLVVSVRGYEPWVYKSGNENDALRVDVSDQLKLQVQLTPKHDKARQPTDEELNKMWR